MSTLAPLALVFWLVLACGQAAAFTAPHPDRPLGGSAFTEGGVINFSFAGTLQGDPAAHDRAFFRIELALASDVSGLSTQDPWPTLANFVITEAGKDDAATRSAEMGVPDAGDYRWRVCAWGVANTATSLDLSQLTCSSSRALVSKAEVTTPQGSAQVNVQRTTNVVQPTHHIKRDRVLGPTTTHTSNVTPSVQRVFVKRQTPTFGAATRAPTFGAPGNSSVHLGTSGLDVGGDGSGAGRGSGGLGSVASGLGTTLPLIPIPFWSLLLFVLAMPLTHLWRRSLIGMFVFTDEDGNRLPDEDEAPAPE